MKSCGVDILGMTPEKVKKTISKVKAPPKKKPVAAAKSKKAEVKEVETASQLKLEAVEAVRASHAPAQPALPAGRPAAPRAGKYIFAVGSRKEATARIRLFETGSGKITVNGHDIKKYFPTFIQMEKILSPLRATGQESNHDIEIVVRGGGKEAQAEAVRHGIARTLIEWNIEFRPVLRKSSYLTRDPRAKERKKFGLKKARRAPQWSKR